MSIKFTIPSNNFNDELKKYGFNIKSDLRRLKLKPEQLMSILQENELDINPFGPRGRLHGNEDFCIKKIRLKKDDSSGKSGGYRMIALIAKIRSRIVVLHIYDKKNKSKLSKKEEQSLEKLWKELKKHKK